MSPVLESVEPVYVEAATVSCDGSGEHTQGHPKVYLKIGDSGEVVCPYCSRRFILAEGAKTASGH